MTAALAADPRVLERFRQLVRERSGLTLGAEKDYLLAARLAPVARETGHAGVERLIERATIEPDGHAARRCVEALATHETYFFRDGAPFEQMAQTLLPELIRRRATTRGLRILSAACSSGQEACSVAMLLMEMGERLAGWRLEIVGVDLSEPVLARARAGRFSSFEVARGLSDQRRDRWMARDGDGYRIAPELARLMRFERRNVLEGLDGLGRFDLILCRNVLIYFDRGDKARALKVMRPSLADDGYLMLGAAETVVGLDAGLTPAPGLKGVFVPAV